MQIEKTEIPDVLLIKPSVFGDSRGWFTESYSKERFASNGIYHDFIQDNHSYSSEAGIIRGLHFQKNPLAQTKLVRCTKGRILDVAVDLRKNSPTYLKWVSVELNEENKYQLLVPRGFAHGFQTLTADVEVQYKVDKTYSKELDRSIRFDDPKIQVVWETLPQILSDKDESAPFLKDSDVDFGLRVLVTGSKGQLGHDVVQLLDHAGYEVFAATRNNMDLTSNTSIARVFDEVKPDIVIHCAAYTQVDQAETDREACYQVNVEATSEIVNLSRKYQAKLVFISTDYVFSSDDDQPIEVDAAYNPVNYYGRTKQLGEEMVRRYDKHFIVRTAWVFGVNGPNFVRTMTKLSSLKTELKVVDDQVGSPTYTKDLAVFLEQLIRTSQYGTYHATNEGFCSWYDFSLEIMKNLNSDIKVTPVTSDEYPTAAKRPTNSRLSKTILEEMGFERLPDWKDALRRYFVELAEKGEEHNENNVSDRWSGFYRKQFHPVHTK